MAHNNLMDNIRSFFGLRPKPPSNDFRNPIWSSDDEDDGDDLYTRSQMEVFDGALDLHQEFGRQMHDMFKMFGSVFGDLRSIFNEDHMMDSFTSMDIPSDPEAENFAGKNIRDYYLKPGYHSHAQTHPREDIDLDGKISSNDISGLLNPKKDPHSSDTITPFNGRLVPGRSFCQTIITTSVTKPDGTVETRRIVKNGNEVIEETTTTVPESRGPLPHPHVPGLDQISSTGDIYKTVLSEIASFFRNYH